jgi:hypothetical protein
MSQVARSAVFALRSEAPRATFNEERQHRKSRLAASYRIFALKGYDHGLAGHITARDPEFQDRFWVAPLGPWFGHIRVSDLVLVDHDGNILAGEGPINQAGFAIHSAIHKARPDVIPSARTAASFTSSRRCSKSSAVWCWIVRKASALPPLSVTSVPLFCRTTAF